MTVKKINNRSMEVAGRLQTAELVTDEFNQMQFSIRHPLEALPKFRNGFLIYRFTDFERSQLKVAIGNPGIVAVIE